MKSLTKIVLVTGILSLAVYSLGFSAEATVAKSDTIGGKRAMLKAVKITLTDAIGIALKKVPGTIIDAELENENNKNIYSFELVPSTGTIINEVNIDAVSGEVISVEDANAADPAEKTSATKASDASEEQDKAEKRDLAKSAKISMADAIKIAGEKAKGTVIDGEVSKDKEKVIFTMEVVPTSTKSLTTKRVILSGDTGDVISTKNLTAKMIAAEKAAEKSSEGSEGSEKKEAAEKD